MILVLVLTGIMSHLGIAAAVALWHWFATHILMTILMVIFLA